MDSYGSMMGRLDLRVTSPDARIRGRIRGTNDADIKFVGNAYREYTEAAMGVQLGALFQLMWTGHRRASLMATAETLGQDNADEESHPTTPAGRELFAKRSEMPLSAVSANGYVRVACVGWRNWTVDIENGTFDALTESEFRAELRSLVDPLMDDYHTKLQPLLDEFVRRTDPDGFQRAKDAERMWRRQERNATSGERH